MQHVGARVVPAGGGQVARESWLRQPLKTAVSGVSSQRVGVNRWLYAHPLKKLMLFKRERGEAQFYTHGRHHCTLLEMARAGHYWLRITFLSCHHRIRVSFLF